MEGHVNSILNSGTSGLTHSNLETIFDDVVLETAALKSLLNEDTTSQTIKDAVSETFEAAELAITSADESAVAAHGSINETDPTTVLSKAETATTKANNQNKS